VRDDDLLAAVRTALDQERQQRRIRGEVDQIRQRIASLTPREQEVLRYVVAGELNKRIAALLGVGEKTIKGAPRARHAEDAGRHAGRSGARRREGGIPEADHA
jgi:FixJ family two-component response regulator